MPTSHLEWFGLYIIFEIFLFLFLYLLKNCYIPCFWFSRQQCVHYRFLLWAFSIVDLLTSIPTSISDCLLDCFFPHCFLLQVHAWRLWSRFVSFVILNYLVSVDFFSPFVVLAIGRRSCCLLYGSTYVSLYFFPLSIFLILNNDLSTEFLHGPFCSLLLHRRQIKGKSCFGCWYRSVIRKSTCFYFEAVCIGQLYQTRNHDSNPNA